MQAKTIDFFVFQKTPEKFKKEVEMQKDSKCLLSSGMTDIIQKIYEFLELKDIKNLFMVCKRTSSIMPRITKITIGEETYRKFIKLLSSGRCSIQEMEIEIERPFCNTLEIPDFNMENLSEITIYSSKFITYRMKKAFDINKITKSKVIKKLEFVFGYISPSYTIHVKDKRIEELSFFSENSFEDFINDYIQPELQLSMKTQDTEIEKLVIVDFVMEFLEPISVKSLELQTRSLGKFLGVHEEYYAKNNMRIIITLSTMYIYDKECFVRVNILRLNRLLKKINKETLKEIYFFGFRAFDEDVLDLRDFKNLEVLRIDLILINDLITDQIELEKEERVLYKEFEVENHLTILLPHDKEIKRFNLEEMLQQTKRVV